MDILLDMGRKLLYVAIIVGLINTSIIYALVSAGVPKEQVDKAVFMMLPATTIYDFTARMKTEYEKARGVLNGSLVSLGYFISMGLLGLGSLAMSIIYTIVSGFMGTGVKLSYLIPSQLVYLRAPAILVFTMLQLILYYYLAVKIIEYARKAWSTIVGFVTKILPL